MRRPRIARRCNRERPPHLGQPAAIAGIRRAGRKRERETFSNEAVVLHEEGFIYSWETRAVVAECYEPAADYRNNSRPGRAIVSGRLVILVAALETNDYVGRRRFYTAINVALFPCRAPASTFYLYGPPLRTGTPDLSLSLLLPRVEPSVIGTTLNNSIGEGNGYVREEGRGKRIFIRRSVPLLRARVSLRSFRRESQPPRSLSVPGHGDSPAVHLSTRG